tara:strand:+ start:429 stop:1250 length:822 start_codon:yes stop_codon:yes gene_type:complete
MIPICNKENLIQLAIDNKEKYQNAIPFPYIELENFFNDEFLNQVLDEFPDLSNIKDSLHYSGATDEKFTTPRGDSFLMDNTKKFLSFLNSSLFINFLQEITSIKEPLIPDPHFIGGGLHQSKRGGFLKVHTDYAKHPETNLDRRLNVLIYLNKDWKEEYNGHLSLYDKDMKICHQKILPSFNKIVIFNTTDFSFHGVPDPILCPESDFRKSIAIYYFSNGRPFSELRSVLQNPSTIYKERPGEIFNKNLNKKDLIKLFIPPILLNILFRFLKR